MAFAFIPASEIASIEGYEEDSTILDTNWQTTAALALGVATGGVTTTLMLAAFPAQTIGAVGGIGVLAYAGKRRADGKSAFPFNEKKEETKSEKTEEKTEA